MADANIIERVACAKYLLMHGVDILNAGGPFAAGMSVLSFQDATEMLLGAVAESINAQVREQIAFNQLLDVIDAASKKRLTQRSSLIQLNRSRVNFKHHGLEPKIEDARKFRITLDVFFPETVRLFFDIDYERISLTHLVKHTRTRKRLLVAEQYLERGEYADCLFDAAVALALTMRRVGGNPFRQRVAKEVNIDQDGYGHSIAVSLMDSAKIIDAELKRIDRDLFLISSGVKYTDLQRFRDLTPRIYFTGDQQAHGNFSRGTDFSEEQAMFCVSLARDVALKVQNQYSVLDNFNRPRVVGKLKVMRDTNVIVYPVREGTPHEVLVELVEGSTVASCTSNIGHERGFTAIFFEGEVAFVSSDDVTEIPLNS